ncbi:hypothetical protein [Haloarcula litorea]|uniref:hypothetical protein n=1 Tax=Haloarcula litorea TaxID=3032579 RepID=UPI0023E88001|nr:hypothetical protein [Halomicroarcula sp. GDY20]
MTLYDPLSELSLQIENYDLGLYQKETSSEFKRVTSVVRLSGDGETGLGEDVSYEPELHRRLVENATRLPIAGQYTHTSFSETLDNTDLFPAATPKRDDSHPYRRWAFESAALDLALKQAESDLADALGREYDPVRFTVSTRLGDPPSTDRVHTWLKMIPSLEFKLDPTSSWTDETIRELAGTGAVRVVDLKGKYSGTPVDQSADPALYERVIDGFPDALIEDPELTEETRPLFDGHERRVTWDYPIKSVESIKQLPFDPEWLNIKPSRFGTVESALETIEYCLEEGIEMYGGGQTELSVGREHIHAFASLFYPDSPNDVAPRGFNDPNPRAGLPESPLVPRGDFHGLQGF